MTYIEPAFEEDEYVSLIEEPEIKELEFCTKSYEQIIIDCISAKNIVANGCQACNGHKKELMPLDNREIIEIQCNGLLPGCYSLVPNDIQEKLFPQDFVLLQNEDSVDIALVKSIGDLVKIKRQYFGLFQEPLPVVLRKASIEDLDKVRKNLSEEQRAIPIFTKSMNKHNLVMKLVSVHYQFDRKKLFFFYTADGRVDFRELAKELASEFKTRIELRQIGVRDEAKKVGGMGVCGREYCCISFLNNFKRITTQLATEQNLLSSMGKLSGPCGKLKCCISYEVD